MILPNNGVDVVDDSSQSSSTEAATKGYVYNALNKLSFPDAKGNPVLYSLRLIDNIDDLGDPKDNEITFVMEDELS